MIHQNVITGFAPESHWPTIDSSAFVHPMAAVIGRAHVGKNVMVAPFASVRADEGAPIFVGDDANVQDGVVLHGLETQLDGETIPANCVTVSGKTYSIYVGKRVSLAHQCQIHGPACIENDTFVGMQSLIFKSRVGAGCVVEPKCLLMGVSIGSNRYVPAGTVLKSQKKADDLPTIDAQYPLRDLNRSVVHVNIELAAGYRKLELGKKSGL